MLDVVIENVLPLLVIVCTPILLMMARGLMKKMAEKLHLEGMLVYQDKIDDLVTKGIQAAEQKALNAVKDDGTRTTGAQKLDSVLEFVTKEMNDLGLPEKAADQLKTIVESKVFEMKGTELVPAAPPAKPAKKSK